MSDNIDPFLFWLSILVGLTTLVGFMPLPTDPDLWFHLAAGEYILAHGSVPQTDPFSFTRFGELWVPHSWLFDVATAEAWHRIGPRATEAVMAIVFVLTMLLSFGLLTSRRVGPLLALAICLGLAIAAGNTRGIRPQVFSLLFANFTIVLLVLHRHRPSWRLLLGLPPLFLLWAQVHAACIMGLVVVAVWLAGRLFDIAVNRAWVEHRRELHFLVVALGLSALTVLITPHAITHYQYVSLTAGLDFLHTQVGEWQAPRLLRLAVPDVYYYLLLTGVLVALARARRRIGWAELGVAGALIILASTAIRHIPLASIGCIPLLADALGRSDKPVQLRFRVSFKPIGVLVVVCLVVLAGLWRLPMDIKSRYSQAEPILGARALNELEGPLRVFTSYNTGSYILWAGQAKLQVFIDSRADVYGDALLTEADLARQGRQWQRVFGKWNIDAAVLERHDPLAGILAEREDWRVLAEDHGERTFVRRVSATADASVGP